MVTVPAKEFKSNWRKNAHYDFGKRHGHLLKDILPERICDGAAATCRFELRGLMSNGNAYGLGFITRMQTFGYAPIGCGRVGQPCVQLHGSWIELTSDDAANIVLGCFGITMSDVLSNWAPEPGQRICLDLAEIVSVLASTCEMVS